MVPCTPIIIWKLKYLYTMLRFQPGMFNSQHKSSLKSLQSFVIKVTTMKNTDDFHCKMKPSYTTTKLTLFAVSKDEGGYWCVHWECTVCTAVSPIGNVKQWKNQVRSLSHCQVMLVWRYSISQSGRQSINRKLTFSSLLWNITVVHDYFIP